MESTRARIVAAVLRSALFVFTSLTGMVAWSFLLSPLGILIAAALGVFAAGSMATTIALRIFETGVRRRLWAIGLQWHGAALRHAGLGLGCGALAAAFVAGLPVLGEQARFVASAEPANPGSIAFISVILLFGAFGEELLFRGYAFQTLAAALGTYQVMLPVSVLFAAVHAGNANSAPLGLFNTFLWGILLSQALLKSGDLWLPIGLHFGWNVTLPLFGVNLSGFTMGLTGYTLEWKTSEIWSGGAYGPEASLLTTFAVSVLFYALYNLPLNRQPLVLLPDEDDPETHDARNAPYDNSRNSGPAPGERGKGA